MKRALCLFLAAQAAGAFVLKNEHVVVGFNVDAKSSAFGSITELQATSGSVGNLIATGGEPSLWSVTIADKDAKSAKVLSYGAAATKSYTPVGTDTVVLQWSNVTTALGRSLGVSVAVTLDGPLAYATPTITGDGGVTLMSWEVLLPNVQLTSTSAVLNPYGSGKLDARGLSVGGFTGNYPSCSASYQFVAAYRTDAGRQASGVYVASHDDRADSKNLHFSKQGSVGTFGIEVPAPGATLPLTTHKGRCAVAIGVFRGDWFDAAQLYRGWVVGGGVAGKGAPWGRAPLRTRTDVPAWLKTTTTWVNTHWQPLDIFNTTGGDPYVAATNTLAAQKRFGLGKGGLALHWYEWDLLGYAAGSNYTKCDPKDPHCGFDTHYPEYFPVRDGLAEAVTKMHDAGIRIAPYINGRIFDRGTDLWTKDDAIVQASKALKKAKLDAGPADLEVYTEQYGSHAIFSPMCPATQYWQKIISDTSAQLVNDYGMDGVYLDEIGCAAPAQCYDARHKHELGGGSHWVAGYRALFKDCHAKAKDKTKVYLTESTAEPYMDLLHVYLTLSSYSNAGFTDPSRDCNIFNAVYGGYYVGMGMEFFSSDFLPNPNVFSGKIAKQFLFGGQLGWFSLIGRNNEHPEVGLLAPMMNPQHDPEIAYLRTLSDARLLAIDYLWDGRTSRDLELAVNATSTHSVGSAGFLDKDGATVLFLVTNTERAASYSYTLTAHPDLFVWPSKGGYVLKDFRTGAVVQTVAAGQTLVHSAVLAPHELAMLQLVPSS